jgi:hypothetical protein
MSDREFGGTLGRDSPSDDVLFESIFKLDMLHPGVVGGELFWPRLWRCRVVSRFLFLLGISYHSGEQCFTAVGNSLYTE